MKTPARGSAIATGLGLIGFGLLYCFFGIFPGRWADAVTESEEPLRFGFRVFLSLVPGSALLFWGLLRSK